MALGALAVLVAFLALVAGFWTLQRSLIYFPDRSSPDVRIMGSGWDEVTYQTTDGIELTAWYRAPGEGQPIVIVFNGNAGSRADRVSLGNGLADRGLGVFLTDYRGYGGNPGHPTERGLARDARAAVEHISKKLPATPLVYFGESLGAAVAIELAVAEPPQALILRSPFTSLVAVGRVHYPWLPVDGLLKDRYPSDERIGRVTAPTLVIAGDADSIVPVDQSRSIYDGIVGDKRLLVIPGADHNDPELVAGNLMLREVVTFVAGMAER